MRFRDAGVAVFLVMAVAYGPSPSMAEDLGIPPVAQETPMWCWAASGQMVLQYYGFPNLNPQGNYQCGVVGSQGGICFGNCGACLQGGGTMQRIVGVFRSYQALAATYFGFVDTDFNPHATGPLNAIQIAKFINDGDPIIAGITPDGVPYPDGWGMSRHAVVIVGYEDGDAFEIIINDPYPYSPGNIPYLSAGATELQPGQYLISLSTFRSVFHYSDSITF